ncbi:2-amino-4-hydroxy-6-hydroxymethyldihydropteridine diphosphokinase [Helicobacter sp. MIT 03-1614]|jgi:2-amino-4-hydroxy-6-hydroxymethyldihydropteridine diphosphokinase|uniref:2-amino-4-hydroxy-6-hydroxymethyldihydropteridine pyrophosphokinase n=1 Tax=Helicobacter hepaticus (strain ATCC 51449 / 3B1) TaxID=235279 RepID=Q7VH25_HELHP|nr:MULTISPECIES: 2-amino-4-hydroxy-6-hydroxymethyldihydropteridine diphosphokinase [Helicobacter]AAP77739.1 7,8-dihydro-6-hydroxymethylpterin-pyrophosphokinase [Helicobacter hepaticus ATCC 51449]TLD90931.1 2-amino-4-hydroxy-6-hydroxymethyldihydropteridine diphosphokinase [Helicobacter sp. MIT 03-1614]
MAYKSAQILSSKHYPYRLHKKFQKPISPKYRNIFMLGLGSNQGLCTFLNEKGSIAILESVFMWFDSCSYIEILCTSPLWRNPPFGFESQDDFYNAIMVCGSNLSLVEIYGLIFYIERRFGRERKRAFKNAPRTLDIDIIFFNALHIKRPYLQVPHSFYDVRASVMLPLSFIETYM